MIKYLTLVVFVFLLTPIANSQVVILNSNCRNAYADILSLRFKDAQELIDVEKKINPDNVFTDYLENYIDFLKVTISEDEDLFQHVENSIQIRIKKISKLNDTCRFKNYFLGNIYLQWATVNLRFRNYATGALEINRAYRLLERNNVEFPDFFPNKITLGILHIMIGIVPDSYHWFLNLISMSGTVEQGREELSLALSLCSDGSEYDLLQDEILFYMGMVDLSLSPDPEYANYLLTKINDSGKSLLLSYLAINTMMKNNRNDDALALFDKIDSTYNFYPFYYLKYLQGDCYLRKLKTNEAASNYHDFVDQFTGSNYIKDAWQKIAWCYLIDGDTASYHNFMKLILIVGVTDIDADKNAQKAAEDNSIPSVDLLKARLLSDGGYYSEADSILRITKTLTEREQIEKSYRRGRIYHKIKDYKGAKKQYWITIKKGRDLREYYAANSALKLGNIYEIENKTDSATLYYNICLDMDFNEYRNSIRGQAKQGLERISKD